MRLGHKELLKLEFLYGEEGEEKTGDESSVAVSSVDEGTDR